MRQLLARLAPQGAGAFGEAVAALCSELRPSAGAAWHLQRRGAAAATGSDEASPGEASAAAAAPAAAAPTKQQKQQQKAPQQPGKPKAQQQQPQQEPKAHAKPAAAKPAAQQDLSSGTSLLSGLPVGSLLEAPANAYIDVPTGVLPEAEAAYYQDPVLKGDNVHEPNYGCKAVQREWEWSGRRSLLARACMRDLVSAVQSKSRPQLYLDGWAGSGKSTTLYSLVAWARANGWLALYIPSAFSLVQTGTFHRGEDGLWDTPEAARWILSSLRDAHSDQLASLKAPSSGQPLGELIEQGLAPATKPAAAVAAAIAAKEALAAQTELPFLLAVDDYNVLYSHTGYYESVHSFHRRQLVPDELRLVRAFRVLEHPAPALGTAVAASTFGQTVTPKLRLPLPKGCRFQVPRYGMAELAAAGEYFGQHVLHGTVDLSDDTLRRALFLTNGNAAELRRYLPGLLGLTSDPLGLSRGYKAEAARRRKYDLGQAEEAVAA